MSLRKFLTSKVFFTQVAIALVVVVALAFVILKWLDGKEPKKFIYVKGRMINVVI